MNASELDIRWPIGLLFLVLGALVAVYGAAAPDRTHVEMLITGDRRVWCIASLNLNLIWGVVMACFGLLMTWGARRASRRSEPADHQEQAARHRG